MSSAEMFEEDAPTKQEATNRPSPPRTRQQTMEKRLGSVTKSVSNPQTHPTSVQTTIGQENSLNVKNEIVESSAPAGMEPDEISSNKRDLEVDGTTADNLKSGTQYISIHFVDNHTGGSGVASAELNNDNGEGICVLANNAGEQWSARISSFVAESEADQENESCIIKELYLDCPATNESADVLEASQGNEASNDGFDESDEPSVIVTCAGTMQNMPTAVNGEQDNAPTLTQLECNPTAQAEVSSPVLCMPPSLFTRVPAPPKCLTNSVAVSVTQPQEMPQVLPHPVSQVVPHPVSQTIVPYPVSQALPHHALPQLPHQALPHPMSQALSHALPRPAPHHVPPPHPVSHPYQHRAYYPVPSTHWGQHVMQNWVPYRHSYPGQLLAIDQHPRSASRSSTLNTSGEELDVSNNSAPSSTTDYVPEEAQNGTTACVSSEGQSAPSTNSQLTNMAGPLDNLQYYASSLRENHNEKERKRRSRIKTSCQSLRALVPGLSEKTDKATVFEYTVQYLLHIKRGVGMVYDKDFVDRYSPY